MARKNREKATKMKYLGLDLSTVSTGWAIFEDKRLAIHGKIVPPKELGTIQRCLYTATKIKEIVLKFDPNVVVIEDTHYRGNYETTRVLNRIAGMAILVIETAYSDCVPVNMTANRVRFIQPSRARSFLGILPKSKKNVIVDIVNRTFGTQLKTADNDEADAIVTAWSGYAEDNSIGGAFKQVDKKFYKVKVRGLKTPRLKKRK